MVGEILNPINVTRRMWLQAAIASASLPHVHSRALTVRETQSKKNVVSRLDLVGGVRAIWAGVRYDAAQDSFSLDGISGNYPRDGAFTSEPFALKEGLNWSLSWRTRWTAPLQWERFAENPLLAPTAGRWDDSDVSTCSVVPTDDRLTMFYGVRDRGIGVATCTSADLRRWDKQGDPVLQAGPPGSFDAGGVISPSIVRTSISDWFMYYVGYDPTRMRESIKTHQIGLAVSKDAGRSWSRASTKPVIALGPEGACDGASVSSNSVLKVGERWYSWYTGISQVPYLASVCLATSEDGIRWDKYPNNPVLSYNPHVTSDAFMVATPHVLVEDGVFKMWYNSKGFAGETNMPGEYQIGYAESLDGVHWDRCPRRPVLGPSGLGWDSRMVEYPEVQKIGKHHYMWFCGNNYRDIGCALGHALTDAQVESRTGPSLLPDATWTPWRTHATPLGSSLRDSKGHVQIRVTLRTSDALITPLIQKLAIEAS